MDGRIRKGSSGEEVMKKKTAIYYRLKNDPKSIFEFLFNSEDAETAKAAVSLLNQASVEHEYEAR